MSESTPRAPAQNILARLAPVRRRYARRELISAQAACVLAGGALAMCLALVVLVGWTIGLGWPLEWPIALICSAVILLSALAAGMAIGRRRLPSWEQIAAAVDAQYRLYDSTLTALQIAQEGSTRYCSMPFGTSEESDSGGSLKHETLTAHRSALSGCHGAAVSQARPRGLEALQLAQALEALDRVDSRAMVPLRVGRAMAVGLIGVVLLATATAVASAVLWQGPRKLRPEQPGTTSAPEPQTRPKNQATVALPLATAPAEQVAWRRAPDNETAFVRVRLPGGGTLQEVLARSEQDRKIASRDDSGAKADERQGLSRAAGSDAPVPLFHRPMVRRYFQYQSQ